MTPAEQIRTQTRAATRRALLQAGLADLIEHGGLNLGGIDGVCARAGYTRGAFYTYFKDRGAFVGEMLEWVLNDIAADLFNSAAHGAADVAEIIKGSTSASRVGPSPTSPARCAPATSGSFASYATTSEYVRSTPSAWKTSLPA